MVSKIIRFELVATPAGMAACYVLLTLYAVFNIHTGLQVIVMPLWAGIVAGLLILLVIDRYIRICSVERIEQVLRPMTLFFIAVCSILLLLTTVKIIYIDAQVFLFIASCLTGLISGTLMTACLKVYFTAIKDQASRE